ncbi:phage tail tape measure protein [Sphingobium yanoikuyae]|uniref:phage tail tape measure protein n=1 Tax=Sphingobium yanoikuyae TaxID=13690 RepID=UPI0028A6E1D8|nr:phage tail tape measure protein [Sphingobium yanoikuyae]
MNNKLSLLVNFIGVDKMSGALKNIVGLGGKGSKSLRALTGDARKLTRDMQSVQREIAKGSGNVTQLVERERDLERQLVATNNQLQRQRRLAAIDADRQAMHRRGQDLKDKGSDNIVRGAALAAPFILATKAAGEFSSGMVDIQQKAELTNQETDRMANSIVLLAAAARQLPEDMRAGVDVLSGFGIDPRTATQMIGPIGRLGTAFKVEIADGASAAYANLNNLKVPLAQTAAALDVMAAAGNAGAFEVKDMARHFPSLTAQMQALGQKGVPAVADLSAALQIARRGAGDADEAANNVQNLLSKINAPATVKAFEKSFGIDLPAALKQAYAKGKTPLEAIADLAVKATGGDMTKLGYVFEDMQAQSALRSLIQNMDDFRKMRADIAKASGTTDRAFDQRVARDATVQWRALMGTMSATALTVGTALLPVAQDLMGTVSSIVLAVSSWANANPQLSASIVKGAAALLAFRMGLGVAQYALGSIIGPLGSVISIARRAGPVLGLLRTAALFMGQGFLRAGAMMLANPIVLIITAIVVALGAAAYLVYSHWDKISGAFKAGVAWVKGAIGGLPDWMRNIGSMMMQGLLFAINPMALGKRLIDMAKYGIQQFKAYLGIKSPSRVFMALGGHVAGGLERGIDGNRHGPARAAGRMAAGVLASGALAMASPAAAGARGRGGAADPPPSGNSYHFHIKQLPGEDAEALAEKVMEKIRNADERRRRRGFEDD